MNDLQVIDVARDAIWTGALVAGPILIVVLLVGVVVGIFQAATSINEMTLSFLPKLIAVTLVFLVLGSWQLQILVDFARRIFERIPDVAG
jgi:flagellar biosynthetic protein FliQ